MTEIIKRETCKYITSWKSSSELLRIEFDISIIVERSQSECGEIFSSTNFSTRMGNCVREIETYLEVPVGNS